MRGRTGADDLLKTMEKKTNEHLDGAALKSLICWAVLSTTNSKNPSKPSAKRAVAISLALAYAFDLSPDITLGLRIVFYALSLAFALDLNLSLELSLDRIPDLVIKRSLALALAVILAQSIENSQIFTYFSYAELAVNLNQLEQGFKDVDVPSISNKEVFEPCFKYWSEAFQFDLKQLISIRVEKQDSIAKYFYSCELIVRCKEAAVRISPRVWQGIEARMLMVPEDS